MIKLFVKDRCGGYVHEIGTSTHDSLILEDGYLHYYNLQNGDGTLGDYEFVNEDGSAIEDEYLRFAWIGVDEPTNKCLQCDQTKEINDLTNRLLITKSEWHDLRKDPNDLPKEDGLFVVYENVYSWGYCDYNTYECVKEVKKWSDGKIHKPIAWKYIEEFEDE